MTSCTGFAIKRLNDDSILIDTVSPTRRAAIVNWLHVYGGWTPRGHTSDAEIEREWVARKTQHVSHPIFRVITDIKSFEVIEIEVAEKVASAS